LIWGPRKTRFFFGRGSQKKYGRKNDFYSFKLDWLNRVKNGGKCGCENQKMNNKTILNKELRGRTRSAWKKQTGQGFSISLIQARWVNQEKNML
jgi:hypothetical protein